MMLSRRGGENNTGVRTTVVQLERAEKRGLALDVGCGSSGRFMGVLQ